MGYPGRRRIAAVVLTICIVSPSLANDAARYDFAPVDAALAALVVDHGLPGCSLRLVEHGDVVYERAVDFSLEQVVPTASAVKWLTGAVVLALVDRGLLDLDDTTGQWLGWTGEQGAITLRQLMSHTSGISGVAAPCLGHPEADLADCVAEIQALPLIGPPGGQFVYGGNSLQVAGRMCEIAAGGRPFVDLFAEYVAGPLALTSTEYTSATNPRLAGGARTTLRDYSRLLEMWLGDGELDGRRVLSAAAVRVALADQTGAAPAVDLPPCVANYHGYGIGNWICSGGEGEPAENSSPGAFRLTPWIDPGRGLAGTFVTVTTADICQEIEALQQMVRDILDGSPTVVPDGPGGAAALGLGPIRSEPGGASIVDFALPEAGMARVVVVDLAGRRVAVLVDGHLASGSHSVRWDGRTEAGRAAASGVYIVTIAAGGVRLSAKALHLRR